MCHGEEHSRDHVMVKSPAALTTPTYNLCTRLLTYGKRVLEVKS
jgi:hypothetical protein